MRKAFPLLRLALLSTSGKTNIIRHSVRALSTQVPAKASVPLTDGSSNGSEKQNERVNTYQEFQSSISSGNAIKACDAFDRMLKSKQLSSVKSSDVKALLDCVHTALKPDNSRKLTVGQKAFMAAMVDEAIVHLKQIDPTTANTHSIVFPALRVFASCRRMNAVQATLEQVLLSDFPCTRGDYQQMINAAMLTNSVDQAFRVINKMQRDRQIQHPIGMDIYLELCERMCRTVTSLETKEEEKTRLMQLIDRQLLQSLVNRFHNQDNVKYAKRQDQLLSILGAMGDMKACRQALEDLILKRQSPPQLSTYRQLIASAAMHGHSDYVCELFQEAKRYYQDQLKDLGFSLMSITKSLIDSCQWEEAKMTVSLFEAYLDKQPSLELRNYPRMLEYVSQSEELTGVKERLESKLKALQSDQGLLKTVKERSFNFRESNANLVRLANEGQLEEARELFKTFGVVGKYPDMEAQQRLIEAFEKAGDWQALGEMVRASEAINASNKDNKDNKDNNKKDNNNGTPSFQLSRAYLETLMRQKQFADAWQFYRTNFRLSGPQFTLPTIQNYALIISDFLSESKIDWATQVLEDLERVARKKAPHKPVWKPPFQSSVYQQLISSLTKTGQTARALQVFKQMSASDNPLQIAPTIVAYNTLLSTMIRDWNVKGFEEIYNRMAANSNKPIAKELLVMIKHRDDRTASRKVAAARWADYQQALSALQPDDPIPAVPSYVSPNRVTENIRLMGLLMLNQMDKIPEAFQQSLHLTNSNDIPNQVTFETLAGYYMRKSGREDFNSKLLQRPIAEKCLTVLQGEQLKPQNAQAVLATVEQCVKEFFEQQQEQ